MVLAELKRRQVLENKSLGVLVSELLATALAADQRQPQGELSWPADALGARIDIADKDAVWLAFGGT